MQHEQLKRAYQNVLRATKSEPKLDRLTVKRRELDVLVKAGHPQHDPRGPPSLDGGVCGSVGEALQRLLAVVGPTEEDAILIMDEEEEESVDVLRGDLIPLLAAIGTTLKQVVGRRSTGSTSSAGQEATQACSPARSLGEYAEVGSPEFATARTSQLPEGVRAGEVDSDPSGSSELQHTTQHTPAPASLRSSAETVSGAQARAQVARAACIVERSAGSGTISVEGTRDPGEPVSSTEASMQYVPDELDQRAHSDIPSEGAHWTDAAEVANFEAAKALPSDADSVPGPGGHRMAHAPDPPAAAALWAPGEEGIAAAADASGAGSRPDQVTSLESSAACGSHLDSIRTSSSGLQPGSPTGVDESCIDSGIHIEMDSSRVAVHTDIPASDQLPLIQGTADLRRMSSTSEQPLLMPSIVTVVDPEMSIEQADCAAEMDETIRVAKSGESEVRQHMHVSGSSPGVKVAGSEFVNDDFGNPARCATRPEATCVKLADSEAGVDESAEGDPRVHTVKSAVDLHGAGMPLTRLIQFRPACEPSGLIKSSPVEGRDVEGTNIIDGDGANLARVQSVKDHDLPVDVASPGFEDFSGVRDEQNKIALLQKSLENAAVREVELIQDAREAACDAFAASQSCGILYDARLGLVKRIASLHTDVHIDTLQQAVQQNIANAERDRIRHEGLVAHTFQRWEHEKLANERSERNGQMGSLQDALEKYQLVQEQLQCIQDAGQELVWDRDAALQRSREATVTTCQVLHEQRMGMARRRIDFAETLHQLNQEVHQGCRLKTSTLMSALNAAQIQLKDFDWEQQVWKVHLRRLQTHAKLLSERAWQDRRLATAAAGLSSQLDAAHEILLGKTRPELQASPRANVTEARARPGIIASAAELPEPLQHMGGIPWQKNAVFLASASARLDQLAQQRIALQEQVEGVLSINEDRKLACIAQIHSGVWQVAEKPPIPGLKEPIEMEGAVVTLGKQEDVLGYAAELEDCAAELRGRLLLQEQYVGTLAQRCAEVARDAAAATKEVHVGVPTTPPTSAGLALFADIGAMVRHMAGAWEGFLPKGGTHCVTKLEAKLRAYESAIAASATKIRQAAAAGHSVAALKVTEVEVQVCALRAELAESRARHQQSEDAASAAAALAAGGSRATSGGCQHYRVALEEMRLRRADLALLRKEGWQLRCAEAAAAAAERRVAAAEADREEAQLLASSCEDEALRWCQLLDAASRRFETLAAQAADREGSEGRLGAVQVERDELQDKVSRMKQQAAREGHCLEALTHRSHVAASEASMETTAAARAADRRRRLEVEHKQATSIGGQLAKAHEEKEQAEARSGTLEVELEALAAESRSARHALDEEREALEAERVRFKSEAFEALAMERRMKAEHATRKKHILTERVCLAKDGKAFDRSRQEEMENLRRACASTQAEVASSERAFYQLGEAWKSEQAVATSMLDRRQKWLEARRVVMKPERSRSRERFGDAPGVHGCGEVLFDQSTPPCEFTTAGMDEAAEIVNALKRAGDNYCGSETKLARAHSGSDHAVMHIVDQEQAIQADSLAHVLQAGQPEESHGTEQAEQANRDGRFAELDSAPFTERAHEAASVLAAVGGGESVQRQIWTLAAEPSGMHSRNPGTLPGTGGIAGADAGPPLQSFLPAKPRLQLWPRRWRRRRVGRQKLTETRPVLQVETRTTAPSSGPSDGAGEAVDGATQPGGIAASDETIEATRKRLGSGRRWERSKRRRAACEDVAHVAGGKGEKSFPQATAHPVEADVADISDNDLVDWETAATAAIIAAEAAVAAATVVPEGPS